MSLHLCYSWSRDDGTTSNTFEDYITNGRSSATLKCSYPICSQSFYLLHGLRQHRLPHRRQTVLREKGRRLANRGSTHMLNDHSISLSIEEETLFRCSWVWQHPSGKEDVGRMPLTQCQLCGLHGPERRCSWQWLMSIWKLWTSSQERKSLSRWGCLLLAISKGYVLIVEAIQSPSFCWRQAVSNQPQSVWTPARWFLCDDEDGTRFLPWRDPIILAAHCQEYEIVHTSRGRVSDRTASWLFLQVQWMQPETEATTPSSHSRSRITAYKGLASPAYLSLFRPRLSHTALELSNELAVLANIEKEFKVGF